jgi:hypothetical protein
MIYLFYGSDVEKVRGKAFAWVAAARKKEPNLAYLRLAREEISDASLSDAAESGGLFARRTLVLIDDPYPKARSSDEGGSEDTKSVLDEHLSALAESDNAIVILAPLLPAAKVKKLVAKAKIEYKFDKAATREMARGFNSGLVNALASHSREKLWLEVTRALREGDAPEMLHGLLHWKARDILEKGSHAWSPREARTLSLALISLLQDSRRKSLDLASSLERFALSI